MMEIVGPERRMEWETIGSFLDFVGILWCRFRHAATSVPNWNILFVFGLPSPLPGTMGGPHRTRCLREYRR